MNIGQYFDDPVESLRRPRPGRPEQDVIDADLGEVLQMIQYAFARALRRIEANLIEGGRDPD